MAKVTVIIPVFSQLRFSESFKSVLAQTYPDTEIIAVSTIPIDDNFKALLDEHKVIYIETTDSGYLKIINKASETASGEIIAYLNEGDTFSPEKIELQVKVLDENPDVGLVVTAYQTTDGDGNAQGNVYVPEFYQHQLLSFLLYGYIFNRSTAIFRKGCYQQAIQCNGNMETELESMDTDCKILQGWRYKQTSGENKHSSSPQGYSKVHIQSAGLYAIRRDFPQYLITTRKLCH